MVTFLTILGFLVFFGVLRVISSPRNGAWKNILSIFWIDKVIDIIADIIEFYDDRK